MHTGKPNRGHTLPGLCNSFHDLEPNINQVLLKSGHIYQHNVLRVNYMTYDVRREQDTFNPNSGHRDIMMLAGELTGDSEVTQHCFYYACIIGIYHVNVQYIGPGLKDYSPRRLDFFHVRWFNWIPPDDPQCSEVALDMLRFVLINDEGAFRFVDPADIIERISSHTCIRKRTVSPGLHRIVPHSERL
jgi:hypothetical protein